MKKFLLGGLSVVVFTCLFAFTDPVPPASKCWNKYQSTGESNGDACVSQSCLFKSRVSFGGAEWVTCGSSASN